MKCPYQNNKCTLKNSVADKFIRPVRPVFKNNPSQTLEKINFHTIFVPGNFLNVFIEDKLI